MRLLGIDLGGTFIKSAVLDLDRREMSDVKRSRFPPFLGGGKAGSREIDAAAVLRAVEQIIVSYREYDPKLVGVAFSTQMHSTVLCTTSGELVSPAVSWQDLRSVEDGSYAQLRTECTAEALWDIGNELRPGHPAAVLYSVGRKGGLSLKAVGHVTSLADWVVLRLTGKIQQIHGTQAGATGLWSVWSSEWSAYWCQLIGIDRRKLPEVAMTDAPIDATVLGKRWKVWSPIGDQQAALLGVGFKPNDVSINVATGSQVSVELVNPPESPSSSYAIRPYFEGRMLATVTHLPAGRALDRWVYALTDLAQQAGMSRDECHSKLLDQASRLGTTGLPGVDLSLFPCATGDRGSLTDLTEENLSAAHIYRASIRSMATNYKRAAERLPAGPYKRILASGGICQKNDMLRRDIAELFQMPLTLSVVDEDALYGLLKHVSATAH